MRRISFDKSWWDTRDYRNLLRKVPVDRLHDRRCLLLSAACARLLSDRITLKESHAAIEAAEQASELIASNGAAAETVLRATWDHELADDSPAHVRHFHDHLKVAYDRRQVLGCSSADTAAMWTAWPGGSWFGFVHVADRVAVILSRGNRESVREQKAAICNLVRDVFEPPTEQDSPNVQVRPPEAVLLAESMYSSLDFSAIPELGVILSRAGCTDTAVLSHCVAARPHIRGCWVIDQLLGK